MLSAYWSDKSRNLWLFSGAGWGEKYSHYGELSDLWFADVKYLLLSECELLNCSSNSHCEQTKEGEYSCVCNSGYIDRKGVCEIFYPCDILACSADQRCIFSTTEQKNECVCKPGFTSDGLGGCIVSP